MARAFRDKLSVLLDTHPRDLAHIDRDTAQAMLEELGYQSAEEASRSLSY